MFRALIIVIVVIVFSFYFLWGKTDMTVIVENTPIVDGKLIVPPEFPTNFPVERESIIDSATSWYPLTESLQFFVRYESAEGLKEKYNEYKKYLKQSGFTVVEKENEISAAKDNINVSLSLKSVENKILVEISYIIKNASRRKQT